MSITVGGNTLSNAGYAYFNGNPVNKIYAKQGYNAPVLVWQRCVPVSCSVVTACPPAGYVVCRNYLLKATLEDTTNEYSYFYTNCSSFTEPITFQKVYEVCWSDGSVTTKCETSSATACWLSKAAYDTLGTDQQSAFALGSLYWLENGPNSPYYYVRSDGHLDTHDSVEGTYYGVRLGYKYM